MRLTLDQLAEQLGLGKSPHIHIKSPGETQNEVTVQIHAQLERIADSLERLVELEKQVSQKEYELTAAFDLIKYYRDKY